MAMGRPRAFDVNEALDRAMKVFWSKGYEGASLAELTRAMKINSPSLYAAFGSKEGLFHAVLDRYGEWRSDFLSDAVAAPTGREVIERFLRGNADLATDPNAPRSTGETAQDEKAAPRGRSRRNWHGAERAWSGRSVSGWSVPLQKVILPRMPMKDGPMMERTHDNRELRRRLQGRI